MKAVLVAVLLLITGAMVLGEPQKTPQNEPTTGEGDNDPTIYPDEVIAPTFDWRDGGGDPPWPWFQPQDNATEALEE